MDEESARGLDGFSSPMRVGRMGMGMCMGFKASLGVNQGTRTSFHEYILAKSEGKEMERRRVVLFSGGALFNFAKSMHQKEGGKSGGMGREMGDCRRASQCKDFIIRPRGSYAIR